MKRKQFIGFKVTGHEDALIRSKAKNSRHNLSEYVRLAALDKKIVHIDGLGDVLPELKRIGNNLNQLTVIMRTRNIQSMDFREIRTNFGKLLVLVTTTLQQGIEDGDYQDGERKVG